MSKKGKKRIKSKQHFQRENSNFTKLGKLLESPLDELRKRQERQRKYEEQKRRIKERNQQFIQDDRRTWHPDGRFRVEKTISGGYAGTRIAKPNTRKRSLPGNIEYENPNRVMVCKRRRVRREVLFTLRKIGKGKGGPKKRRLSVTSQIKC